MEKNSLFASKFTVLKQWIVTKSNVDQQAKQQQPEIGCPQYTCI